MQKEGEHSQREAWQTFSGQQWTQNNVVSQHHSKTDFKNHTEMIFFKMCKSHKKIKNKNQQKNLESPELVT